MSMDSKRENKIWIEALSGAILRGFDYEQWLKVHDLLSYQIIFSQAQAEKKYFNEVALRFMSYTKMKAIAFSHEFACAFFPKMKCVDLECQICKTSGHDNHIHHMQQMCTYDSFTAYLEKILDEED